MVLTFFVQIFPSSPYPLKTRGFWPKIINKRLPTKWTPSWCRPNFFQWTTAVNTASCKGHFDPPFNWSCLKISVLHSRWLITCALSEPFPVYFLNRARCTLSIIFITHKWTSFLLMANLDVLSTSTYLSSPLSAIN